MTSPPCVRTVTGSADPEVMAAAAVKFMETGYDLIDLNFACPVRKALSTLATHAERVVRRWTSTYTNARLEGLNGLFQAARARARVGVHDEDEVEEPFYLPENLYVIGTMNTLEQRLEDVRTPMDVAVIGCIVNGPGEAREADVGLTGASPNNLIYISGEPDHKISNDAFIDHLEQVIRDKAAALESERAAAEENIILKTQA